VAEAAAPAAVQAAGGVRSVVDAGALLDAGAPAWSSNGGLIESRRPGSVRAPPS
jgi:hypothetical protein